MRFADVAAGTAMGDDSGDALLLCPTKSSPSLGVLSFGVLSLVSGSPTSVAIGFPSDCGVAREDVWYDTGWGMDRSNRSLRRLAGN